MKIHTVRKINLFEYSRNAYTRLKIVPDSSARNTRSEEIVKAISDMFRLPIDRLVTEGWKIKGIKEIERASFEIRFEEGTVCFYLIVPSHLRPLLEKRISSVWDRASVSEVNVLPFDFERSTAYELRYAKHDILSLHTDAKDNLPLDSIIDAGRLISEGERASVFTYFEPIHQVSWQYKMNESWEKLKSGVMPRNITGSPRELIMQIAVGLNILFREIFSTIGSLAGSEGSSYNTSVIDAEASKYAVNNLSNSTRIKRSKAGIKTQIWTLCESESYERAELVARSLSQAFGDIAGDNEIRASEVKGEKKKAVLDAVNNHKHPKINLRSMIMSTAEASKVVQIAGDELQQKYKEIERIDQKQVELSCKHLFDEKGLFVGHVVHKSKKFPVYQPVNDIERLCLPMVIIGGMGAGKTKGAISNRLVEAVKQGFGGLVIDPNKREVSEQLLGAVKHGYLAKEQVEIIDLSKVVFGLDFIEATKDERSLSRLSNMFVYFFNVAEETSGQTERFLRAAVMGMSSGRVIEAINILSNEEHLKGAIERVEAKYSADNINLKTLKEFESYKPDRRRQIMAPIFNRMAEIMSDDYLDKSLHCEGSLDFVEIMSKRKAYVLDIPSDEFDKVVIDTLVNMIALKIDLAMRLREKLTGESFPFFVQIDEPHQFSKSTKVWEDAVVESRKWRVPYTFAFHNWGQLPKKLQEAIRSAICHYHLYKSHSDTFTGLRDEILPFEKADGINLAPRTAITIFETGDTKQKPFICHMANVPINRCAKIVER